MRHLLYTILIILAVAVTGCAKGPEAMNLNKTKLEFSSDSSTQNITSDNYGICIQYLYITDSGYNKISECKTKYVNNNGIESKGEWISAKRVDDYTISITLSKNDTGKERYAIMDVTADTHDVMKLVKIVQKAK
jgi:hypothetical protein